MMLEEGRAMREDAGRGWRRVVPSPRAREIVELEAIATSSRAAPSSSAPAAAAYRWSAAAAPSRASTRSSTRTSPRRSSPRSRRRRAAHPDRRAPVLSTTARPTSGARPRDRERDERLRGRGHFKAGSMGPKVEACLRFATPAGSP